MSRDYIDVVIEQGATYKGILKGEDPATVAVNGIFADIRGRKFLKWMFDDHEPGAHQVAPGVDSIDLETQTEIAETWRQIIDRVTKANGAA